MYIKQIVQSKSIFTKLAFVLQEFWYHFSYVQVAVLHKGKAVEKLKMAFSKNG